MQGEKLEIVNSVIIAWKTLFNNFLKFFVTFLGPLLGYLFGLFLCIAGIFLLLSSRTAADILPIVLILVAIGLIVFCYFFWRFLVVSASTYIVAKKLFETGEEPQYSEANKSIEARAKDYIILLLLLLIITTLPFIVFYMIPVFLIPGFASLTVKDQTAVLSFVILVLLCLSLVIVNLYLTLAMPLFALNENLSPRNCVKLSFSLVGKNFWQTVGMLLFFILTTAPVVLLCYIPIIGTYVITAIWSIVSTPLVALVLTRWYLEVTRKTVIEAA